MSKVTVILGVGSEKNEQSFWRSISIDFLFLYNIFVLITQWCLRKWGFSYLSQSEIIMCHDGHIGCYDVLLILASQKLCTMVVVLDVMMFLAFQSIWNYYVPCHGGRIGCYDVFHILANQKLLFPVVDTLDVISKQNKHFLDHWNTPVVSEVITKMWNISNNITKACSLSFWPDELKWIEI